MSTAAPPDPGGSATDGTGALVALHFGRFGGLEVRFAWAWLGLGGEVASPR